MLASFAFLSIKDVDRRLHATNMSSGSRLLLTVHKRVSTRNREYSGLAYPGRLGQFAGELLLVQIGSWSSDDCFLVRLLLLLVLVLVRRQTLQLGVDGVVDVIIGVAGGDIERRQCCDRTRHRHQIAAITTDSAVTVSRD